MVFSSIKTEIWYLIRNRDKAIFKGSNLVRVIWPIIVFIPLKGVFAKKWKLVYKCNIFISTRVWISVAVPQCLRTSLVIKSFLQISECKWKRNGRFPPILLISGLPTNPSYFRTTYQSFLFQDYPLILLISGLPTNPSYFRTTQ